MRLSPLLLLLFLLFGLLVGGARCFRLSHPPDHARLRGSSVVLHFAEPLPAADSTAAAARPDDRLCLYVTSLHAASGLVFNSSVACFAAAEIRNATAGGGVASGIPLSSLQPGELLVAYWTEPAAAASDRPALVRYATLYIDRDDAGAVESSAEAASSLRHLIRVQEVRAESRGVNH